MTSYPRRDPVTDQLLTPENSALILIDYQPTQVESIGSMNHHTLIQNVVMTAKLAQVYKVPIILSTVNVKSGRNKDTIPDLKKFLVICRVLIEHQLMRGRIRTLLKQSKQRAAKIWLWQLYGPKPV